MRPAFVLALLTLALPSVPGLSTEKSCGEHTDVKEATCDFRCDAGDALLVEVTADDTSDWTGDVYARGSATCGDGQASCKEKDTCSDTATAKTSGNGKCSAGTDERIHDGFTWHCSSTSAPPPPGPGTICEKVPELCDAPDVPDACGAGLALAGLAEVCTQETASRVYGEYRDGYARALVCHAREACVLVPVACATSGGWVWCDVVPAQRLG